jgi:hypothetical protein
LRFLCPSSIFDYPDRRGQFIGIGILVVASMILALTSVVIPLPYIGLLGVAPIYLGCSRIQVRSTSGIFVKADLGGNYRDRCYGLDFAERLRTAGFMVEMFRMAPAEEVTYGLLPMEWLYVATRDASRSSVSKHVGVWKPLMYCQSPSFSLRHD